MEGGWSAAMRHNVNHQFHNISKRLKRILKHELRLELLNVSRKLLHHSSQCQTA